MKSLPFRSARAVRATLGTAAFAAGALACGAAVAADLNAVNRANEIASSVVVGSAVPSLGFGAVLQTLVGLAVVIGLVFGCAWLARRFGFQPVRRGGPLKVVASVAVGGKETATVVEIGDTWLVLGVGPGNVRLLHTLPAGQSAVLASGASGMPGARSAQTGAQTSAQTPGAGPAALSGTFGEPATDASFGARFRDALVQETARRFGRGKER
ncbi:flagellar biosynthetic protein FliO [Burkholderia guangdongensis]|uniref:flagellar biosynthetic protein FliO n=1 Tax=Burkholderia guangdongensis TaxID=1792500 RepID=UPI0015CE7DE5|nr:flagellar biosynthetic protein FliO [Burkholderia guangdongensis]